MNTVAQTLGYLGSVISILTLIPQVVKTWRTRSVKDISGAMLGIQAVNVMVWLLYGYLLGNLPLVVVNVFMFTNTALLILLKVRYSKV